MVCVTYRALITRENLVFYSNVTITRHREQDTTGRQSRDSPAPITQQAIGIANVYHSGSVWRATVGRYGGIIITCNCLCLSSCFVDALIVKALTNCTTHNTDWQFTMWKYASINFVTNYVTKKFTAY